VKYVVGIALLSSDAIPQTNGFGKPRTSLTVAPNLYRLRRVGRNAGNRNGYAGRPRGYRNRDGQSVWVFDRLCTAADDCSESRACADPEIPDAFPASCFDELGAGMFIYPHVLFIDRDESVWVPIEERRTAMGHTVRNSSKTERLLMTLWASHASPVDCPVFQCAFGYFRHGQRQTIFVATAIGGDTNARIRKLDKKTGGFIKAWWKKGTGPVSSIKPHGPVDGFRRAPLISLSRQQPHQIFESGWKNS